MTDAIISARELLVNTWFKDFDGIRGIKDVAATVTFTAGQATLECG